MKYSLYIHIPFCLHRCAYCDFNTYAGQMSFLPAYVKALCTEIEFVGRLASGIDGLPDFSVETVYFGGGTPSLLSTNQFESILDSIYRSFKLADKPEITIEANPGSVSLEQLEGLRSLGINRLSLGVQSSNHEELKMLERTHDFFDVIHAVTSARQAGIASLNLDLIYGLPEQSLQTWKSSVERVVNLHPEHISAYALTLEHGTPFGRWSTRGSLASPDPDLAADMYEWASEFLEDHGFRQYEISNWSLPGFECQHNLQYWHNLPYMGFGAGAHGYAAGYRYSNVLRIKTYIERMTSSCPGDLTFPSSPATLNLHRQTSQDEISEYMITNLRLTRSGVSVSDFYERFGCELTDKFSREINELNFQGLLEWHGAGSHVLRLTSRGRLLGNQVFMRFL